MFLDGRYLARVRLTNTCLEPIELRVETSRGLGDALTATYLPLALLPVRGRGRQHR